MLLFLKRALQTLVGTAVLLVVGVMILYLLAGQSPGKRTLVCGPYERGGSIYRIGSTGEPIESCTWIAPAQP